MIQRRMIVPVHNFNVFFAFVVSKSVPKSKSIATVGDIHKSITLRLDCAPKRKMQ